MKEQEIIDNSNPKPIGLFIHYDNGDMINIQDLSKPEYDLLRLLETRGKLAELLSQVCEEAEITIAELQSKSKQRGLADIRAAFFRMAKEAYPDASLCLIGEFVNRDHSTVIAGIKRTKDVLETGNVYWSIADGLKKYEWELDYAI
jgi:chromosomal replication initiation ATPase DnaA